MRAHLAALALAALATGCTARTQTFGLATDGHPPPLAAGQRVAMWDHYCAGHTDGLNPEQALTRILAEASDTGWELVAYDGTTFCFKRPRASIDAAPGATPTPDAPASAEELERPDDF